MGDLLADREIDRATYARQSTRLRTRIEERAAQLTSRRGSSVLDHLGGHVEEQWDTMSADDQRLVLQTFVESILVAPNPVKGRNRFDPSRLSIRYAFPSLARLFPDVDLSAEVAGAMIRA